MEFDLLMLVAQAATDGTTEGAGAAADGAIWGGGAAAGVVGTAAAILYRVIQKSEKAAVTKSDVEKEKGIAIGVSKKHTNESISQLREDLKKELKEESDKLRADLKGELTEVRGEIKDNGTTLVEIRTKLAVLTDRENNRNRNGGNTTL